MMRLRGHTNAATASGPGVTAVYENEFTDSTAISSTGTATSTVSSAVSSAGDYFVFFTSRAATNPDVVIQATGNISAATRLAQFPLPTASGSYVQAWKVTATAASDLVFEQLNPATSLQRICIIAKVTGLSTTVSDSDTLSASSTGPYTQSLTGISATDWVFMFAWAQSAFGAPSPASTTGDMSSGDKLRHYSAGSGYYVNLWAKQAGATSFSTDVTLEDDGASPHIILTIAVEPS